MPAQLIPCTLCDTQTLLRQCDCTLIHGMKTLRTAERFAVQKPFHRADFHKVSWLRRILQRRLVNPAYTGHPADAFHTLAGKWCTDDPCSACFSCLP